MFFRQRQNESKYFQTLEKYFSEYNIKDIKTVKVNLPKYNKTELVIVDMMIHDMIKWFNKDKIYIVENYGMDDYLEYSKLEQWNQYRDWETMKANKNKK